MANNVIGLFENEGVADQVVEELLASGFDQGIINRFKGNNDQLEDELRHEGIPADEASYYVNGLKEGGALVSVRAEESQTDTAVEIMNRFVAPAGGDDTDSGVTDDAAPAAAGGWGSSDVPARSGDTDRYAASSTGPETDYKGVDADSADYDGVGSSTGYGSASGYSDTASDPASDDAPGDTLGAAAAGDAGLIVGREAYDAYNRERAARGSAAPASSDWGSTDSSTDSGTDSSTGSTSSGDSESVSISDFPVGREAYASYRPKPTSSDDFGANSTDAQASTGASSSADGSFPVGREAYASYQPKPAGPASPSSAAAVKAGRNAGAANAAKLEALVERLERVADRLEARGNGS